MDLQPENHLAWSVDRASRVSPSGPKPSFCPSRSCSGSSTGCCRTPLPANALDWWFWFLSLSLSLPSCSTKMVIPNWCNTNKVNPLVVWIVLVLDLNPLWKMGSLLPPVSTLKPCRDRRVWSAALPIWWEQANPRGHVAPRAQPNFYRYLPHSFHRPFFRKPPET